MTNKQFEKIQDYAWAYIHLVVEEELQYKNDIINISEMAEQLFCATILE